MLVVILERKRSAGNFPDVYVKKKENATVIFPFGHCVYKTHSDNPVLFFCFVYNLGFLLYFVHDDCVLLTHSVEASFFLFFFRSPMTAF